MGADIDFPNAHSMEPDDMTVRQRLFDLRIVVAKALSESLAPLAAPPHLQKIIRRTQPKGAGKQYIVPRFHLAGHANKDLPVTKSFLSKGKSGAISPPSEV
ncbi:MAG TPA: hypothetical protein PK256_26755 [Verrucomicrobiota bacterium]|nr:hypothetical protein [Verrucomicrobiota bacterium]